MMFLRLSKSSRVNLRPAVQRLPNVRIIRYLYDFGLPIGPHLYKRTADWLNKCLFIKVLSVRWLLRLFLLLFINVLTGKDMCYHLFWRPTSTVRMSVCMYILSNKAVFYKHSGFVYMHVRIMKINMFICINN